MRSPLTHFSEHYVVDLMNTEEMQKWYKYSYSGIIVNCHDAHTMNFAGSDKIVVTFYGNIKEKSGEPTNVGCYLYDYRIG